ncbi:MAG: hypothetical protein AAGD92_11940 [Pseudomonadota bacterium]
MREAPVGLVGVFFAGRPYLTISILSAGLVTLAVMGARAAEGGVLLAEFGAASAYALAAPLMLAALAPTRNAPRLIFAALVIALVAGAAAIGYGLITLPPGVPFPDYRLTLAAGALFVVILVLAPLAHNVMRLGLLGPLAAVLGATGAGGYLAYEGLLMREAGAAALALGLAFGASAGVGVASDFASLFAAGAQKRNAAAAAGHRAVAISTFSLLLAAAYFTVFAVGGAVDIEAWRTVLAGVIVTAAAVVTSVAAVSGGLALTSISEQAAVDENRRRRWFARQWRPIRLSLPPATAAAGVAIAGILVVIAIFENGFANPALMAGFIAAVIIAAGVAFVSIRTSLLIAGLLTVSAVLADMMTAVMALAPMEPSERFCALALAAGALGHLCVSWRDAGERWRNARDVVENAFNDGLRRLLVAAASSAGALYAAASAFGWAGGVAVITYFLCVCLFALLLAPAAMTVMSARLTF